MMGAEEFHVDIPPESVAEELWVQLMTTPMVGDVGIKGVDGTVKSVMGTANGGIRVTITGRLPYFTRGSGSA